jgi:hypothetical protein
MANSNGWGDGSVNNAIGWGQGANNTTGWGKSHINSWAGATDIDGGNLPSNSVAPAITGTAQEGQTLTCSTGTWSGSPTYTYQWKRNGSNITSATNSTYTLVTADVGQSIKCTVTATNFIGSSTADSNTVTPASAFTGLLDTYSGATAAYSLRRLRTAYTGNCIRVRRSSDNTEQDFGFVANVLDSTSLLSFVGAGDGYVARWYDQSGNRTDVGRDLATSQPKIVSSGAILNVGGIPAVLFALDNTSSTISLLGDSVAITQPATAFIAANRFGTSDRQALLSENTGNSVRLGINVTDGVLLQSGENLEYKATVATGKQLHYGLWNGTNSAAAINNDTVTTGNGGTNNSTTIAIGSIPVGFPDYTWIGHIFEVVLYNSNQSSNKSGISTNINTYYSIY